MHADAFGRARKLLISSSPNAQVKAAVLGVVHSLLMLSLLVVAGLLAGLLVSQGETRLPIERSTSFPQWMPHRVAGTDGKFARVSQHGTVFPGGGEPLEHEPSAPLRRPGAAGGDPPGPDAAEQRRRPDDPAGRRAWSCS